MADYQAVPTTTQSQDASRQPPVTATLVCYVLFALAAIAAIAGHGMMVGAPLLTIIGVVAVIVAYLTRGDARGTWTESHLTWLIRTFWWSFLWNCLGWILVITLIGIPVAWVIWVATTIWVIYRLVRGYLYFKDSQAIPGVT